MFMGGQNDFQAPPGPLCWQQYDGLRRSLLVEFLFFFFLSNILFILILFFNKNYMYLRCTT